MHRDHGQVCDDTLAFHGPALNFLFKNIYLLVKNYLKICIQPEIWGGEAVMIRRDYYLILGVSRDVSSAGIKAAFRRLVKKYHPDVAGSISGWEFQEIIEAYEVLSVPILRRYYDEGLAHAEGRESSRSTTIVSGRNRYAEPLVPEPISMMRDFLSISQPIEGLFERIFRNFTGMGVPKAERPESLTMELILSPEEALTGGRVPINVPVLYPCHACRGSGRQWSFICSVCSGKGMVEEEETAVLHIPPRVRPGAFFEMPLAGLGIHNLYLRVLIRISNID
jgi:molecular chaperone DnaJ